MSTAESSSMGGSVPPRGSHWVATSRLVTAGASSTGCCSTGPHLARGITAGRHSMEIAATPRRTPRVPAGTGLASPGGPGGVILHIHLGRGAGIGPRASSFSFVWGPSSSRVWRCPHFLVQGGGRWQGGSSSRLVCCRGAAEPGILLNLAGHQRCRAWVHPLQLGKTRHGTFTALPKAADAVPGGVFSTADPRRAPAAVDLVLVVSKGQAAEAAESLTCRVGSKTSVVALKVHRSASSTSGCSSQVQGEGSGEGRGTPLLLGFHLSNTIFPVAGHPPLFPKGGGGGAQMRSPEKKVPGGRDSIL
ncbi:hypothetical protein GWK47_051185 [Chionoecetes opilio]|uniref:Uncharacterized protein n=1 Tax=Chionoecetes opilio TaxID=41210 RepID=A0A8J4YA61_CHIOP|nr:hypothetical protein GWK47_051185 [Chionoecetes opilio]